TDKCAVRRHLAQAVGDDAVVVRIVAGANVGVVETWRAREAMAGDDAIAVAIAGMAGRAMNVEALAAVVGGRQRGWRPGDRFKGRGVTGDRARRRGVCSEQTGLPG